MKKWFLTILFILITVINYLIIDGKPIVFNDKPDIFHIKNSTVLMLEQIGSDQYQAYCAGVWVSPNYFLTANHCISDTSIFFQTHENKNKNHNIIYYNAYQGKVIRQDEDRDLALILSLNGDHSSAKLADTINVGDKVWALGHPNRLVYSISEGIISSKRTISNNDKEYKLLQVDATIGPGNSGGGLFNSNSELLGICSFTITNVSKFGFFVDIEEIKSFLNEEKISLKDN